MANHTNSSSIPEGDGKIAENGVKIICLGDSAVGKSNLHSCNPIVSEEFILYKLLVERFLMDGYQPQQLSTFALTLFRYETKVSGKEIVVDFWDTAGQERFSSMHPSYYHQAHACILVFDVTRKVTYKNLSQWYKELREYRPEIPCVLAANKIDVDYKITQKNFNFSKKHSLPFFFVSAADGTNVVKMFREAIRAAVSYKENPTDFMDEIMKELEDMEDLKLSPDSGLESATNSEGKENGNVNDGASTSS